MIDDAVVIIATLMAGCFRHRAELHALDERRPAGLSPRLPLGYSVLECRDEVSLDVGGQL